MSAVSLVACFPPSGPEESTSCIDEGQPYDGATALLVGRTSEEGEFVEITDGAAFGIDVGSQGLQHIYYSARVHTGGRELVLTAKFTRDDGVVFGRGAAVMDVCTERWVALDDARLVLDENAEMKGKLEVKVGACAEEGCAVDASGEYVFDELVGEVTHDILVNVYI